MFSCAKLLKSVALVNTSAAANMRWEQIRRLKLASIRSCVDASLKRSVNPFQFWSMKRLAIILSTAIALTLIACDKPDTAIDLAMDRNIPPTFSFSGPWWAIDFEVIELRKVEPTANNQYRSDQKTIWKISLQTGMRVKDWPQVTYGLIPKGFSQVIPSDGKAPMLVEGKTYAARALDTSGAGGAIYFVIQTEWLRVCLTQDSSTGYRTNFCWG
jgi:hypothetical protein